ncbi:PilZ domain-containing protein [Desulfurivibrio alkaliphilus]|uniref:Type IV pilus assembly PilZ n=1 Tax=Desulfurivibrio alkaliphilus (strain DSM 19089 / UNIQEM U267 / AHT2) TaxID=589865 RepID=D6Z1W2_DESAT|nr:PilZ domain-containing protein [Desulfurivibrio alkaliphilus]ADH85537.1 type IV pilus assembly PilZ [Desulfurivibrio alkaliphilus AHT 2]
MNQEQVTRHSFRLPVSGLDEVTVKINGREREIFNLSNHGIGVRFRPPEAFDPEGPPLAVELKLGDVDLRLTGKVVHISREGNDYLCGIDLVDLDETSRQHLLAHVARLRAQLFKSDE